jgi:hypothetical protein
VRREVPEEQGEHHDKDERHELEEQVSPFVEQLFSLSVWGRRIPRG